ncbi:hypothetical protein CCACVL1_01654, partial [Corchorus capsularis]
AKRFTKYYTNQRAGQPKTPLPSLTNDTHAIALNYKKTMERETSHVNTSPETHTSWL